MTRRPGGPICAPNTIRAAGVENGMADTRWIVPLLIAAALGGCLQDDDGADPSPTPEEDDDTAAGNETTPIDLAWGLSGCQAAVVFFDVDSAAVQPHLPEGFAPRPIAQGMIGGGPNPTQDGSFGIEMFTCDSGAGLNGTVEPMTYGSYFAFVDPPDALEEDVDFHFVKWDVLVPDEPRREFLQTYGLPARNGTAAFSSFSLTQSAGSFEGTLSIDGNEHGFSGQAVAPGPDPVSFVEFMEGANSLVAWRTSVPMSAVGLGPGTVDVPSGTLAAEVLGPGMHEGNLLLFEGAFEGGSIKTVA